MEYGESLLAARKERKLSRKALSKMAGISEMTIRRYESGERMPRVYEAKRINQALGVHLMPDAVKLEEVYDIQSLVLAIERLSNTIELFWRRAREIESIQEQRRPQGASDR